MSRFRNSRTGVVVSVADSKDDRFGAEWEPAASKPKAPAKKSASSKSEK